MFADVAGVDEAKEELEEIVVSYDSYYALPECAAKVISVEVDA